MTWDGRLDNRDQLLLSLGPLRDTRPSDLAIAAAAFERWGTDCFRELNGDWAVSIWDPHEDELLLARDQIGVRHLFYQPMPDGVTWCTELAALVRSATKLSICEEYIAGYLAFYPDAHLTPYVEILSVPPGHFVLLRRGKAAVHSYWRLNPFQKTRYKSDAEYEDHFRVLFRQAVRRRLRTDSPIIAGLSGGYDSTAIVFTADDIIRREGAETPRLDTFSYYDSREPDDDDLVHIMQAEQKRGRRSFRCEMSGSGDSLSFEYLAFVAAPGFGLREEIKPSLARVVKGCGYRVSLSGLGGDEMNGQPLDFRLLVADLLTHLHPVKAAQQLVAWSLLTRIPVVQLLPETIAELLPIPCRAILARRAKVSSWVDRRFARAHRMSFRLLEDVDGCWFWRPAARDAVQTVATLSRLVTHLPPSFAEQRYPYLDKDLVEFLVSVPLDQLLRPGERRSLMRRALADLLPLGTLHRKTKAAAARCYAVTLQKHWEEVSRLFEAPVSSSFGFVEPSLIREALLAMKNGHVPADFTRLLKALSLELWLRDVCARGVFADPRPNVQPASELATQQSFDIRLSMKSGLEAFAKGGETK